MKQRYFILLILFVIVTLTSCRSVSYLTIDLTEPPKENLPDAIQSLTLVNRAVDKRFTNDPRDTIQLRFYESQFNLDTLIYDVQAADTLMKALASLLYESGRYDVVIPENRFLTKDTLNQFSQEMSWSEAEDLTKRFNTDAVLSLDYYKTRILGAFGKIKNVNWDAYSENTVYLADMRISYIANLRLYYPLKKDYMLSYFLTDTLEWVSDHFDMNLLFKSFTKVKDALSETAISAAFR